jgi:hypothetical protein
MKVILTIEKLIKNTLGFFAIILLRTIKGYFTSNNKLFRSLLLRNGFHPSVVNNPSIVFNNYKSESPTIYIHFYAKVAIKVISFCVKKDYCRIWEHALFSNIGLLPAYSHDAVLMLGRYTYTEIKIPEAALPEEKILIYSVMIGDYDEIFDPVFVSGNCDYILFTDNVNIKTKIWKIHLIQPNKEYSNKWNVCYYKMLAYKFLPKQYKYSIYVDAKVFICGDIRQILNFINERCKFAMIKHGDNNTHREEIDTCIEQGLVDKEIALNQYNEYKLMGFPDNIGLVDTCILVREHNNSSVIHAMDTWFAEFDKYPMRDQLSIMYAVWKSNVNYKIANGSVWNNQFMVIKRHKYDN